MSEHADRFRSLYEAEFVAILGYAARRLERSSDAADVAAEVFTIAWRRIGDVPRGPDARLWLYGVARYVMSNQRRSNQRRGRLIDRLRGELQVMSNTSEPQSADLVAVRDALRALSNDDRELLLLTTWEGLSPTEIAVAMDIPAGTVRSRLHRARQQLRRELGGDNPTAAGCTNERSAQTGHVTGSEQPLAARHEDLR